MNDTMLKFGPYNVTPGDIWTLVPVQRVGPQDYQLLNTSLSRTFIPGWLVDSVFIVVILSRSKPVLPLVIPGPIN